MRILTHQGILHKSLNVGQGKSITNIWFNHDCREILILLETQSLLLTNIDCNNLYVLTESKDLAPRQAYAHSMDKNPIIISGRGDISFLDIEKLGSFRSFATKSEILAAAVCPVSNILATGSQNGVLRIFEISDINDKGIVLVFRERMHIEPIMKAIHND